MTAALHSPASRPVPGSTSGGSSGDPVDSTGPRALDPSLPAVFGRYLLIQRISRGGMGEIFLAKHGLAGFEKLCVIKKVLPSLAEDEQFISRFIDEAGVAIKLQHVNVAQVFEVGRVGDEYFLALEYVEGRDLRRTLTILNRTHRRMPVDLALFIAREMAQGLAYAHRRTSTDGASLNLVHCDISPPNVVVSFEGETKIIDFGIAKSALRATATDPKMGFGKFGYMAPEQLVRGGQVDHRTDIYAVGVVLFELLTGQRLYEVGDNPDYRALARQVVKGEFRRVSELDPALAHLDELVVKALTPKAEDRYQAAAELRDAIQQALISINPTISTDALGAFMRDLFGNEMTQQRELLDRAAAAHLADFEAQLTTQSTATVSFALANMPLYQPPTQAIPRIGRGRRSGQQSVVVAGVTGDAGPRRKRIVPVMIAMGLGMVTALGLALALGGKGEGKKPASTVAAAAAAAALPGETTVVAVEHAGGSGSADGSAAGSAEEIEMPVAVVDEPVDPPRPPPGDRVKPAGAAKRPPPRDKTDRGDKGDKGDKPEVVAPDAAALTAKFRAATREYKAYKERNGSRLESEWTDLASMVGYLSTPEKRIAFDKKVDRLRAKMRE
ncbi:MAG TPA: serine/threonine-protein kinase [Kofleriaceae bacterium]|nr:serine/threonine-protein kinase [Kofleriaceae bacterium]